MEFSGLYIHLDAVVVIIRHMGKKSLRAFAASCKTAYRLLHDPNIINRIYPPQVRKDLIIAGIALPDEILTNILAKAGESAYCAMMLTCKTAFDHLHNESLFSSVFPIVKQTDTAIVSGKTMRDIIKSCVNYERGLINIDIQPRKYIGFDIPMRNQQTYVIKALPTLNMHLFIHMNKVLH